ncbi:TruB family pseudouridylate synthase containing protein [Ophiocordyceps camponoti-floridani]|uniref:tRNA pseudouridine(55) synthase n=1 Tax=Ophiocordyceps camponoti-floridani TaxID=2030778 RepID=A0A8H4Q523_9HYPO|nr:TruB family pseudouridylate synthase containing protein [Ophiocordyceps camponoti-floridani]
MQKLGTDAMYEGLFAVNKPCGPSSAQVVRECQKHFNQSAMFKPLKDARLNSVLYPTSSQRGRRTAIQRHHQVKIGHGGTLDPLATGVLILGIGSATKLLSRFLDSKKVYETTILFGASTDTYDRVGRVLTKRPYDHITKEKVEEALITFCGEQMQTPPLYSALKMNGKPLYEYARAGVPIPREIERRKVEADVELLEWFEPGSHSFRWPTEEAETAERDLAEKVWRLKTLQDTGRKKITGIKVEDDEIMMDHETFKRMCDEKQDELITDKPNSKPGNDDKALMSGALGTLPAPEASSKGKPSSKDSKAKPSSKGLDLVPPPPDASLPPPWTDKGPPACRVRLTVSSGYYVRSFCHDLGAQLDSAAFMFDLCRTKQGYFRLDEGYAFDLKDLEKGEDVWGPRMVQIITRWQELTMAATPKTGTMMKQLKRQKVEEAKAIEEQKAAEEEEAAREERAAKRRKKAERKREAAELKAMEEKTRALTEEEVLQELMKPEDAEELSKSKKKKDIKILEEY